MKRMILTLMMVFLLGTAFTLPEEKAPPITKPQTSQGVWHIETVIYTLMHSNNLWYELTLRYVAWCSFYPDTFTDGHLIWQRTINYLREEPTCDPYMEVYSSFYNQYVTCDAAITIIYKNIYGGVYYDQEVLMGHYPPFSITNPIEYPD